jgi:cytochrome P450
MREIAERTVEEFLATGGECDFVDTVAEIYPLRIVTKMLGIPESDQALILSLTKRMFSGMPDDAEGAPPSPTAAAEVWSTALAEFHDYFRILAADRRRSPKDDLISVIANAKVDGGPLIERYELDYTTLLSTSGSMLGLIRFPDQFALLKENPDLTEGFINEGIRYSVPVRHFMRTATADIEIRGQKVRAGDRVFMSYPSANRDPEVFSNPDMLDIRRPNAFRNLSFGSGPHMCLGQHVAKLDMRILFETLMPRLASIELAGDPKYLPTNFIGGLCSLPVRFRAA